MPVRKVKGGYQWGSKGKVYPTKAEAKKQGRAAYANGYRGDMPKPDANAGQTVPNDLSLDRVALPSDPMQPMPPPADPPKGTQNRGGQPMSMPDPPVQSWGEGPDKNRWPTLGGSGLAGGFTKIG